MPIWPARGGATTGRRAPSAGSTWPTAWRWPHGSRHRCSRRLPKRTPAHTPSTKAEVGDHDENIDFAAVEDRLGSQLARKVRDTSIAIYRRALEHAADRGIIVADTKFEFGLDREGRLHLIDEVLTPDSSRFWPAGSYAAGTSPPSFDKQFVRDYLDRLKWDRRPPGPHLPAAVVQQTAAKYREAYRRLTAPL